jgi:molecular chaperone GrpE
MARPDADPDLPRRPAQGSPEPPRRQAPQSSPAGPRGQAPQASGDLGPEQADAPPAHAQTDQIANDRIANLEDRLRRALADADNMRKRCERQVVDARADERARVAAAWLPIVDNLERALEHADANSGTVIEGIRVVRDQAVALLGSLGFRRHDETDVPFDPQLHEAVSVLADGDAPAGTVLQVLHPGYGEGARQLRPAAVVVAGGPG